VVVKSGSFLLIQAREEFKSGRRYLWGSKAISSLFLLYPSTAEQHTKDLCHFFLLSSSAALKSY